MCSGPKIIVRQRSCPHSSGESQAPPSSSSPTHLGTYFPCPLLWLNHLPPHPRVPVQAPLPPSVFVQLHSCPKWKVSAPAQVSTSISNLKLFSFPLFLVQKVEELRAEIVPYTTAGSRSPTLLAPQSWDLPPFSHGKLTLCEVKETVPTAFTFNPFPCPTY